MSDAKHHGLGESLDNTAMDLGATNRAERKEIIKAALREAAKECLDDRYKEVGKWSVRGILAAAFAALVYFIATHGGFLKP
jgi:hypothetical protein